MHGAGTPFCVYREASSECQNAYGRLGKLLHMRYLNALRAKGLLSVATSNMMRVTGRCKSDLVTSPHQRVVGLGPRQQPTVDTFGVAPAKGTDQNLYSDCSGMCRLRREGLAASSCFKVLYPYFGWLGIPERFEDC